ncbi:complex I NDUFA9 subunit family protein [Acetobacter oeni]|uniref:3-beta-hydroxy-Delta(5)-steroid dehydrogenase n=1 Tax=Acetobacter oeni TaxID=304077 RepID=A0A511XI91_9PROT|nr:complex I NDUFA9 subunit family protein [Acetobacter oeni]NHO19155.1 NAD-dependent epimerase/dehydratase family protein [Acetobacter oeni]GEN62667.1 3-beta-hydroxy-Delta(5)-steroid dehydrogenase [Acetobacter oeni]
MTGQRVATVFGGSGFLGKYVVRKLAQDGYAVRVACRRTDLANSLRQLGAVGQISPFYAPVQSDDDVNAAVTGADVVINLAAILSAPTVAKLEAVNVKGAARVARLAAAQGVGTLVQMSAIGASTSAGSAYARSRGAGEEEVRLNFPAATIVRASVLFGPEDHFLNLFAALARYVPLGMPVYGFHTLVQPVYVADVAEAIRRIVATSADVRPSETSVCELGGPEVLSMADVCRRVLSMTARSKPVFAVPSSLAALQAAILERLPGRMLTRDQLRMLAVDNVTSDGMPGFQNIGMAPVSMDLIAPAYLQRYAAGGGEKNFIINQMVDLK